MTAARSITASLLLLASSTTLVPVTSTSDVGVCDDAVDSSSACDAALESDKEEEGGAPNDAEMYFATIIGAGAAGLSAAHRLLELGIDIDDLIILEASDRLGGRVRADTTFLGEEHPIDLGAANIGNAEMIEQLSSNTVEFQPVFEGDVERTFVGNYTWYNFLVDHMAPKNPNSIVYDCQVDKVDHMGSEVKTSCGNRTFVSEYVIVTAPLQVLRDGDIAFEPPLPLMYTTDHPGKMWKGYKFFVQFSKYFFRGVRLTMFDLGMECAPDRGESNFWDYAVKSGPDNHVLAGCIMGDPFEDNFGHLTDDQQVLEALLALLDERFDGQASQYYSRHLFVNWTNQPFVRGTYSSMGFVGQSHVDRKVFMAGEAFPLFAGDEGWVHGALRSGWAAALLVLKVDEEQQEINNGSET